VIAREACNVGRYINSPNEYEECNLKAEIVLIQV
jgi:hypothetical protein